MYLIIKMISEYVYENVIILYVPIKHLPIWPLRAIILAKYYLYFLLVVLKSLYAYTYTIIHTNVPLFQYPTEVSRKPIIYRMLVTIIANILVQERYSSDPYTRQCLPESKHVKRYSF